MKGKISAKTSVPYVYIAVVLGVMPLLLHNGYFDTLKTKRIFFMISTYAAIGLYLIVQIVFGHIEDKKNINIIDFLFGVLGVFLLINSLCCHNIRSALFGSAGWGMGTVFWLLCVAGYFLCSMNYVNTRYVLHLLIATSNIVVLQALANIYRLDPLGVIHLLRHTEKYLYISTIGNVNWYSEYCCILLPIFVVVGTNMKSKNLWYRIWIYFSFMMTTMSAIACGSDTAILGIMIVCIYITFTMMMHPYKINYLYIVFSLIVGSIILRVSYANNLLYYPMGKIQLFFLSEEFWIWGIGILLLAYFGKGRLISMFSLICVGCIFLFRREVVEQYLIPSDKWGTNRGYIWKYSCKIFANMSWKEKIVGCGMDEFGVKAQQYYNEELYSFFDRIVVNAHSHFFQLLITGGILAIVIWYSIIITAVCKGMQVQRIDVRAISLSIISFGIQGFVNNFQPCGLGMMIVLVGILNQIIKKESKPHIN